jgi:RimJ/RimL family protein N-acetyltransferase
MTEFRLVAWPPAPIKTERLVLRGPEARDRSALIELFTSPEVGTYIGGPSRVMSSSVRWLRCQHGVLACSWSISAEQ